MTADGGGGEGAPTVAADASAAGGWPRFASWPPLVKLGAWLAGVYGVGGLVQVGAWVAGAEFEVFGGGGRDFMHIVALVGLTLLAMHDEQPLADAGLALSPRWGRRVTISFLAGFGFFAAYLGLLLWLDVVGGKPVDAWYRWAGFVLLLPPALIAGYLLQIVFSGYLLGELRRGVGVAGAIVLVAVLFGLVHRIDGPWRMTSEDWMKFAGLALLGALLATIRLVSGDILISGGILSGIFYADRLNRDTGLARELLDTERGAWLAPHRDPLQAPAVWAIIAAALAVALLVLARRGESRREKTAGIPRTLKRVYPFGMMLATAPIDLWWRRLREAGWRVPPAYWGRLVAALGLSVVNTLLCLPERLLTRLLRPRWRGRDPVFIVGVHRSGTTHLHNLLALDRQFVAPRMYQVLNPTGFLVCGWALVPLLALFLPWRRPMDGVRYNLFSPNEEEFALAGTCGLSPMWGMVFPRRWPEFDRFIDPDRMTDSERRRWEHAFLRFLRRLTLLRRRRPLLKNPYSTARVAALRAMFPRARFIHLRRDPQDVYRSNLHLEQAGHVLQQLQDPAAGTSYGDRFPENYRAMEEAFERDAAACEPGTVTRLRYEDLVRDAAGEIRRVYDELGLAFTESFARRLARHLARAAPYRRTTHEPLAPEQASRLEEAFIRFGVGAATTSPTAE